MLVSRKPKKIHKRKIDWFPNRTYVHFDAPISRSSATALVKNPKAVERHGFLPLIAFEKRERRFIRRKDGGPPDVKFKIRQLAYCSNKDACIFSYYAQELNNYYENYLQKCGIQENVIGYRKIGSNIDLAYSAFAEIKSRGSCIAFAYDISGFFDHIDHSILKENWARILGKESLPDDHFRVFKNLTKFSTVNRRACLRRLGLNVKSRDRDLDSRRLCTIEEFRQKIRGDDGIHQNLIVAWKRDYRIPQGTPLSALAANIAMLNFDIFMRIKIDELGGSYRRYSDDILVIVPSTKRDLVKKILTNALAQCTKRLHIKDSKTNVIAFLPGTLENGRGGRALQYLGFMFDGEKAILRSSTIAKFYRKMFRGIAAAKKTRKNAKNGKASGRETLYRRQLLLKHSRLGSQNFMTTYAATATKKMGNGIARQLNNHLRILNKKIQ